MTSLMALSLDQPSLHAAHSRSRRCKRLEARYRAGKMPLASRRSKMIRLWLNH
jgi:hypothetical protein